MTRSGSSLNDRDARSLTLERRTRRASRLLLGVLALPLALTVAVAGPGSGGRADAATIVAPGIGNPVTMLPSVVIGAKSATSAPEALALVMMQYVRSPAALAASRASLAGTATVAQAATVAAEAASFAGPATKAFALTKLISGASVPMIGFQLGLSAGGVAARMAGFKDDQVCAEQNGILTVVSAVTNGVDCSAYNNLLTSAQRNFDQAPSYAPSSACVLGRCVSYVGRYVQTSTTQAFCFTAPVDPLPTGATRYVVSVNFTDASTNTIGVNSGYAACQTNFPAQPLYSMIVAQTVAIAKGLGSYVLQYYNSSNAVVGTATHTVTAAETAVPNPTRNWECKINFTDGTNAVGVSPNWTETDPAFNRITCPTIPSGKIPDTQTISETGGGVAPLVVGTGTVTPEFKNWRTAYPDCGTGLCQLDLQTAGVSCYVNPVPCVNWFTDPNKTTNYQCKYGTYSVVLTECNTLSPSFDPAKVAAGHPLADPQTGLDVPAVKTGPSADDATAPGMADTGECYPSGWAVFNPVEWVLKPIKCAFEPRASVIQASVTGMQNSWSTTPPAKVAAVVSIWATQLPTVSGCTGPHIAFTIDFWKNVGTIGASLGPVVYDGYPLSACDQPAATLATTGRIIGALVMYYYAGLAVTRYIGGIVGNKGLGESS